MLLIASCLVTFGIFSVVLTTVRAQYNGDDCIYERTLEKGRCIPIDNCKSAKEQLRQSIFPQTCSFERNTPIVCCPLETNNDVTGTKINELCEKYNPGGSKPPKISIVPVIIGGKKATSKEFPHMAVLGFGDSTDIQWSCGGSLVSKRFVLTAAHCLYSKEFGNVRWVRVGDLNIRSTEDDAQPQSFTVKRVIRHPKYAPPIQYNDIALVELNGMIRITPYVRPACIQTTYQLPSLNPVAVGWGDTVFGGDPSDHLMKVTLDYFSNEYCRNSYSSISKRKLPYGILDDTQICAGGKDTEKDTCQGDSGGPLQVSNFIHDHTVHHIIGVTSFGKACGIANSPGVYTRVSHYLPWIETSLFPN